MKVIVSHIYSSDNKGDAALASVLIQDIRRAFKKPDITLLTLEKVNEDDLYEGAAQQQSFNFHAFNTYNNRIAKLLYSLFIMIATILWAFAYRWRGIDLYLPKKLRKIARLYKHSDIIIAVGGGYLRSGKSFTSTFSLLLLFHTLFFGYLIRKPTVLYTQSVGPFYRPWEFKAVKYLFSRMNLVILREEISKKLLEKLGVTKNVVRSVDSGFLLNAHKPANLRKKLGISKNTLLFGITVRKWLDKSSQAQYETAMAHIVEYITQKHKGEVVFIPQVTSEFHNDDDRQASQDVYQHIKNKDAVHVIMDNVDHYAIKAMYDELDCIIGTRFHSVIFSLTSYVPALAIEYEHKTSGIMNDLDLSQWVVKIENIDTKLLEDKVDALIRERKAYVSHLQKVLPPYIKEARQAIVLTKEAYEKTVS